MKKLLGLFVIAVLSVSVACSKKESGETSGGSAEISGKVTALGSSTAFQLIKPLGEAFEKKNPKVRIDPEQSSTSNGYGAVKQGMNDIGLVTRAPLEEEKGLVAHVIARDGMCIIVHKDNPVTAISDEQMKGILAQTIKNWKEVGGKDEAIDPLAHDAMRNSLVMFAKHLGIQVGDIKYAQGVFVADPNGIEAVAHQPNSITYMSIASALNAVAEGKTIKMIGLRGVEPTVANVENGTVPLTYDVSFLTKDTPTPQTKAFIDFATSAEAQPIIKSKNFAPKK